MDCFVLCTFAVPKALAGELDRLYGGEEPDFAVGEPTPVRLWMVPAHGWPQHTPRHETGVPAHGFEIGWLPVDESSRLATIRVESQCHWDPEHARITIDDLTAWFAETVPMPVALLRSEIYG